MILYLTFTHYFDERNNQTKIERFDTFIFLPSNPPELIAIDRLYLQCPKSSYLIFQGTKTHVLTIFLEAQKRLFRFGALYLFGS